MACVGPDIGARSLGGHDLFSVVRHFVSGGGVHAAEQSAGRGSNGLGVHVSRPPLPVLRAAQVSHQFHSDRVLHRVGVYCCCNNSRRYDFESDDVDLCPHCAGCAGFPSGAGVWLFGRLFVRDNDRQP